MKYCYLPLAGLLLAATTTYAQSVGIGTSSPNTAAALDITATGKGLLIPRLDSVTRATIPTPPAGLLVYQTDGRAGFWYYTGSAWAFIPDKLRSGDNLGNHRATRNLTLNGNALVLRDDVYHGLVYAPGPVDGPSLYGYSGGSLGYNNGSGVRSVLRWNSQGIVSVAQRLVVDSTASNTGLQPSLTFASARSGEGIGSARSNGNANQYGLDFYTSYAKRLSIDNYGSVGINTAAPTARLDVNGRTRLRGRTTAGRLDADTLLVDLSSLNNGTSPAFRFGAANSGEGIGSAHVIGSPNLYGLDFYTNSTKRLSLDNYGGVGVGTDAPTARLDVNGRTRLRNVATGTRLATDTLQVGISSLSTGAKPTLIFGTGTAGEGLRSAQALNSPNIYGLDFYTNSLKRVSITNGGSVGIGTDAPNSTLQVTGSVSARIRTLTSGTVADNDYTVLVGGNVSLPAPSPANTGRLYNLLTTGGSYIVSAPFQDASGTFSTYGLNNNAGARGIVVQSDGAFWWIISRQ